MATIFKRGKKGNWIIQYFDADGRRQTKSSRTTDKAAADRIAAKIEADIALRRDGVIDSRLDKIAVQSNRSIGDHLDDFADHQRAKAGLAHIEKTRRFIEKICDHSLWKALKEIDADGVNRYAANLRSEGRAPRTVQSHLTAILSFTRWAVKTGRLSHDPLATVTKPNPDSDRRRIRRYISHEEFQWLDGITRKSEEAFGMTGFERALLYETAIQTGLRANELRSLTRGKFHLTEGKPFIVAAAKSTKNKKLARQYISSSLASELKRILARKVSGTTAFNMPSEYDTADMLRSDLRLARVAWLNTYRDPQERIEAEASDFLKAVDSEDERLDFHSLRHTCASWLIASGADVKTVQVVMRHADIRLTMDRYGHLFPGTEADAIERLGQVIATQQVLSATGTDGNGCALQLAQQSSRKTMRTDAIRGDTESNVNSDASASYRQQNAGETAVEQGNYCGKKKEASVGVEPTHGGFAIHCLSHLATTPCVKSNVVLLKGHYSKRMTAFSSFDERTTSTRKPNQRGSISVLMSVVYGVKGDADGCIGGVASVTLANSENEPRIAEFFRKHGVSLQRGPFTPFFIADSYPKLAD